jgi:hypothetical protein
MSRVRTREQREDMRDWCPLCEVAASTTEQLALHMKDAHQRIILEIDINANIAALHKRMRLIAHQEDILLA